LDMVHFSVLIVDDEIDFLDTIVNRLKLRKIDAAGTSSGEDALALMASRPFDVVVLDIKMPGGMDGIETLRAIKQRHPSVEVILLTGHASVETSIEGMKLGAFDYLLKPMRFEELLIKIASAFEKKALHESRILDSRITNL